MSDITAAIEARVTQYRDRLIEESRKRGNYWLTPEGRAEIHSTWDTEGDGNCVLPLLREVERLEAQAERAEQQIARLRERIAWQPIATAPKDSSRILIYSVSPNTGEARVHLAWWAIPYEGATDAQGWWDTGLYGSSHPVVPRFVHGWMPLPAPPDGGTNETGGQQ